MHDFLEKVIEHKLSLDFLYKFSETSLILRRNERDIAIHVYWSSCKVPVILV